MSAPADAPASVKTEQVHCPSCGQQVEVHLIANGGMFAGPCKCGVSVGAVVTAFGAKH